KIDPGPAISAAVSAPNNHPEPMIDPTAANRSPMTPISRLKCSLSDPGWRPAEPAIVTFLQVSHVIRALTPKWPKSTTPRPEKPIYAQGRIRRCTDYVKTGVSPSG